ncbi:cell division cycle protein [Zopfochytrium polystomum]|nr:cell division cycle protein [Zopfochytrium polystomum]
MDWRPRPDEPARRGDRPPARAVRRLLAPSLCRRHRKGEQGAAVANGESDALPPPRSQNRNLRALTGGPGWIPPFKKSAACTLNQWALVLLPRGPPILGIDETDNRHDGNGVCIRRHSADLASHPASRRSYSRYARGGVGQGANGRFRFRSWRGFVLSAVKGMQKFVGGTGRSCQRFDRWNCRESPPFSQGCVSRDAIEIFWTNLTSDITVKIISAKPDLNGDIGLIASKTIVTLERQPPAPEPAVAGKQPSDSVVDGGQDWTCPAGLEVPFEKLAEIVETPLVYPNLVCKCHNVPELKRTILEGLLLYGPPGISASGADIVGSHMGETEGRLRKIFGDSVKHVQETGVPVMLFLDEIDSLAPNRTDSSYQESRMVATLLTLMDGLESRREKLIVVGATNRPNALDPALRRPGRFDREVCIDLPNEATRLTILNGLMSGLTVDADVDAEFRQSLAESTNGFAGADLSSLCREAAIHCSNRLLSSASDRIASVNRSDFLYGLSRVTPSASRGSTLATGKPLKWEDVGGLEEVKLTLKQAVEWPLRYKDTFERLGLAVYKGILLYGPPGCSKTTLARVIASTCRHSFIALNGATLFSSYLGESERIVRNTFHRARASAPSIVFIDEIDTIVGKRGLEGGAGSGDSVQERVLSTLLNEMDGIEMAKGVVVMGATNRPDLIDKALLRPGRFDRIVYVPAPDLDSRLAILRVHTRGMPLAADVSLAGIAERTDLFTGADLEALCREAALGAMRERYQGGMVETRHFDLALKVVRPSVTPLMAKQFAALARYSSLSNR